MKRVLQVIQSEFFPIIRMCTSSGRAVIKTDNEVFYAYKKALKMAIAILSERGFEVRWRYLISNSVLYYLLLKMIHRLLGFCSKRE